MNKVLQTKLHESSSRALRSCFIDNAEPLNLFTGLGKYFRNALQDPKPTPGRVRLGPISLFTTFYFQTWGQLVTQTRRRRCLYTWVQLTWATMFYQSLSEAAALGWHRFWSSGLQVLVYRSAGSGLQVYRFLFSSWWSSSLPTSFGWLFLSLRNISKVSPFSLVGWGYLKDPIGSPL